MYKLVLRMVAIFIGEVLLLAAALITMILLFALGQ